MYVGADIENTAARAVTSNPNIVHMGSSQPGQSVADFVIHDGVNRMNIDVTGSSASSVNSHLDRSYISGRGQLMTYTGFSRAVLGQIFR
jgi:hypothetical protein